MSGWPDPDKPGVPLNPERNGFHWIVGWNGAFFMAEWDSECGLYGSVDAGGSPLGAAKQSWTYAGPVLTPAEADALRAAADVRALVNEMRVDLADGFWLAAKVALAALEPSDGVFYARDQGEHLNLKRAHHRVKQKLEEAAAAWDINMEEKP